MSSAISASNSALLPETTIDGVLAAQVRWHLRFELTHRRPEDELLRVTHFIDCPAHLFSKFPVLSARIDDRNLQGRWG